MPIADGYGWFLLDYFLTNDFADVIAAANSVFSWIDSVKGAHSSVSLLGIRRGWPWPARCCGCGRGTFRAVVGLSGFVLDNDLLALSESFDVPPPFFWGRDKADLVINDEATDYTAEWLDAHTRLTARTYPGMGHAMSKAEMVDVSAFLRHYVLSCAIAANVRRLKTLAGQTASAYTRLRPGPRPSTGKLRQERFERAGLRHACARKRCHGLP